MKKAAKTMPSVQSVGGASAGVPIKNDCVWNDCFPRVNREDYKRVCLVSSPPKPVSAGSSHDLA